MRKLGPYTGFILAIVYLTTKESYCMWFKKVMNFSVGV